ncbi:MAG: HAD-IIIC family phosphatase [Caulobacteraceae bacterium]
MAGSENGGRKIKCVVWDLDNTVWNGVLLEDENVALREGITEIIKVLDSRGILQSIASKNEYNAAINKLKEFGLEEYFLYPQINWNSKSSSILNIAKSLNIGIDTLAFVDDQEFERNEVRHVLPQVLCIDADDIARIPDMQEMTPQFITADSKIRRQLYQNDIQRKKAEEAFEGPHEEFLASLDMVLTIAPVRDDDLHRTEELTVRTHQLNATGYTYSYKELDELRKSDKHKLLIASLDDKYGTYGHIGLALIELQKDVWILKLLLMSCRVISRGVGSIMLNHIMRLAKKQGVTLRAEFVSTDRNRLMYITYKFAGFKEVEKNGNFVVFENDLSQIQPMPEYVEIKVIE